MQKLGHRCSAIVFIAMALLAAACNAAGPNADGEYVFTSTDTPKVIPSNRVVTVTSKISITTTGINIGALNLDISFTHTRMSDITMKLVSPNGMTKALSYVDNKWNLSDPMAFAGIAPSGTWTLSITDSQKKNGGTLSSWSMVVTPKVRLFTYRTIDGLNIPVRVIKFTKAIQPAIVHIHGGALIMGNSALGPFLDDRLLAHGYTIISIDYRLAPQRTADSIWDDIQTAYNWITINGPAKFQINTSKIGVYGDSAGGFLSQIAGYRLTPRPLVIASFWGYSEITSSWLTTPSQYHLDNYPQLPEAQVRGALTSQVIFDSMADPVDQQNRWNFYVFTRQQGIWPQEVTGFDPVAEVAQYNAPYCPLYNVTPWYPPTIFVHGDDDQDVPVEQSLQMAIALQNAGVAHQAVIVPYAGHGLTGADQTDIDAAYDAAVTFLNTYLK